MRRSPSTINKTVLGMVVATVAVAVAVALLVGLNLAFVVGLLAAVFALASLATRLRPADDDSALRPSRFAVHLAFGVVVTAIVIQAIPYGRSHDNPAVTGEPQWVSTEQRDLMVRACYGCHSNEVEWPWYANVAPVSWAITSHVDEGRSKVNYSEFDQAQDDADDTLEVLLDGSMPPAYYTRFGLHTEANLTDAELADLIDWVRATPGLSDSDD